MFKASPSFGGGVYKKEILEPQNTITYKVNILSKYNRIELNQKKKMGKKLIGRNIATIML